MHLQKKGVRVLGIAESFASRKTSVLAGVVMRRDRRIDGFRCAAVTVGGVDATDAVLSLYAEMDRRDINAIMLSGCVIAWYNIIDPATVAEKTGLPVVVVTYEDSTGLEEDLAKHFPGDSDRLERYRDLGSREAFSLHTGHTLFLRAFGIDFREAGRLCDIFTLDGKIPEPLRVARLCARGVMHYTQNWR
ncbi:endonuclease V-like protein UPF0215 family [Methanolinea mesophila]|uniref:endonuclease dU n=1 Tax=Methanolinea mesophila TaxID=547055 RepID=UPI001AE27F58|nr:DUF99 family protein [Methanolinea mesophila]MBP1927622.1 endonuclease V-like protein UPF0215 family [Methanolinea mesophila]